MGYGYRVATRCPRVFSTDQIPLHTGVDMLSVLNWLWEKGISTEEKKNNRAVAITFSARSISKIPDISMMEQMLSQ